MTPLPSLHMGGVQIKELAADIHSDQGVGYRCTSQLKELTPEIHPDQRVGPGDTSRSRSWPRIYTQIKELDLDIHPD